MINLLFLIITSIQAVIYNTSLYTLGNNLINNYDFSLPAIQNGTAGVTYPANISGWTCNTECDVKNMPETCSAAGVSCNVSFPKGVDLDSTNYLNSISQIVSINITGQLYLQINWMPAFTDPIGKMFRVKMNQASVGMVSSDDANYTTHTSEFILNANAGDHLSLQITQLGNLPTGQGIIIGSVTLMRLIPINSSNSSNIGSNTNGTASASNTSAATNSTYSSNSVTNSTSNSTQSSNSTNPGSSTSNSDNSLANQKSGDYFADENLITLIMLNNFTLFLNRIPGNRIFFSVLMNFLITFDRLQLYYFHNQNFTYYATVLLSNVNTLQIDRGNLPQTFFQDCANYSDICQSINNVYESLSDALNQKYAYSSQLFLQRNSNGIGFFANHLDFFYYKLPSFIIIYIGFNLIFRALFKYRLSVYFRRYSFYGILLLIIYEGNVQQFSFYFLEECKFFFSANFIHKSGNVFMTFFFFLTFIFSIGGLIWFKYHYKKLVKYFTEEYKIISLFMLVLESLQKSVFPLFFGCVHSILIDSLALQTIGLGAVEIGYFCFKLICLRTNAVLFKFKVSVLATTSLLRMTFIVTLFLFEFDNYPPVINLIHHSFIWCYLLCWIIQSFYDLLVFLVDVMRSLRRSCSRKNTQQRQQCVASNAIKIKDASKRQEKDHKSCLKKIKTRRNEKKTVTIEPVEMITPHNAFKTKKDKIKSKTYVYGNRLRLGKPTITLRFEGQKTVYNQIPMAYLNAVRTSNKPTISQQ